MLRGRQGELAMLDGLVKAARDGESRVLVIRGEPGVGKSALLDYVAERGSGCRVARAAGVESEMELAFAGLHQLCASMLDQLGRLPVPQRDVLRTAFGLTEGPAPDRFLVGLAVLGLLSEVAAEQPLVCLVDDAQWLDRESLQALEFVARRLLAESVALVFAARPSEEAQLLAGLPQLVLEGLSDSDARALLASMIKWPLDQGVGDRLVAETRGNPLALIELPRELAPAELAGGFALPGARALSRRIEDSFLRRLARLPGSTRRLLLIAAVEPVGDSTLVWRAAEGLGIGPKDGDAAESDRLVEFGARVIFRHPLVRSAIYRSASPQERREAHSALAEAIDPVLDPDRRAWQLAQATSVPDENVASELERSAGRAQARGGFAAASAFLERSAALTLDPPRRAERTLAAAQAKAQAGEFDAALRLLAAAEAGPLEELQQAQADLLRGQIAFASSSSGDASPLLVKAARRFEPIDVELARETYLEALSAAVYAARDVTGSTVRDAAEAARAAPAASQPPSAPDLLLDGLALLVTEGYAAGAPALKRALSAFSSAASTREEALRWLWLACPTAVRLWDDESWDLLSLRHIELARDAGALGVLPIALNQRAGLCLYKGDFAEGASMIQEASAISEATGSQLPPYASLALAAFRGGAVETLEAIEGSAGDVRAEGVGPALLPWATAVLYNSLGRYENALAAAQKACKHEDLGVFGWGLVELVEAGARGDRREVAAAALERLAERTRASATDWALGVEARSRALLSDSQTAGPLYREAIERLARSRIAIHLARAHLLYGEWLRRERRRTDAREQLRTAHEMFITMGAGVFAERTRRELQATGETARKRTVETRSQLTPQETQVAQLARDGLSNPEIGARLFISASTVQYHLRKVFMKLDISSRMHLARALPADPSAAQELPG
ncbi:MAG: ATP-dependent transcriptional regulator, MalT-like, LuxR family [Solirubrobacterales bacterium]|nr:ATP-dependent transcriptional regulator, MalT-like, LuxR family [Solirubrobacterales bacterium]